MAKRGKLHLIHNVGNQENREDAAERAILDAVEAITKILRGLGYDVRILPLVPPYSLAFKALEALEQGPPVFNLFEGFPGDPESEVQVRLLLDRLGFAVTGCPALAMHIGLHKAVAKRVLRGAGVPVPNGILIRRVEQIQPPPFPFPIFIKPSADDASHGIGAANVIRDQQSFLERGRELLQNHPLGLLAEPFLDGREFNCSVIEGKNGLRALPPSIVDYSKMPEGHPPVLTFEAKWAPDSEVYKKSPTVCPAPVEPALTKRIQDLALKSAEAIGIRGYGRVDMREDGEGNLMVLEVNPNPDISPDAGMAKQARAIGWDYPRLLQEIVAAAGRQEGPWK
jgi:D-alanine-D-alanine ligase